MKFLVIFAIAACFCSVQADDEAAFNATRVAIKEVIIQTANDFDAFLEGLMQGKMKLIARMEKTQNHFVRFSQTPKGRKLECARELVVKIYNLQGDFQHRLDTSPEAIAVEETIDEFMEKMAICYSDLAAMERYFDCPDEECKQIVHAEADEHLRRSIEGLRVKGMVQKITDNYPGVDAIVEEFNVKHKELKKELPMCAMKKHH